MPIKQIAPIAKAIVGKNAPGSKNWFSRMAKRILQEERGQEILDDLIEKGISPKDVSGKFWNETYWKLPAEGQERFEKYLKTLTGLEPGRPLSVGKTGEKEFVKDWLHLAENYDFPPSLAQLEGSERGYFALMDEASRRFIPTAPSSTSTIAGLLGPASNISSAINALMSGETFEPVMRYLQGYRGDI